MPTDARACVAQFCSHCWERPNWSEELSKDLPWESPERQTAMAQGTVFGDPDDADHSKAKALIEYAKWFKRACTLDVAIGVGEYVEAVTSTVAMATSGLSSAPDIEIFWWIDWCCANQDDPRMDIAALPAFAASCAGIVAVWNGVYQERAWCQLELLVAYAFMTTGTTVWVVPPGMYV